MKTINTSRKTLASNRPIIIYYDATLDFYKLSFYFRGYSYFFFFNGFESLSSAPLSLQDSVRKHFDLSFFNPLPDTYIKSIFVNIVTDKYLSSRLISIINIYLASTHDPIHLAHLSEISKTFSIDCRVKTTLSSELSYINKLSCTNIKH